MTRVMIGERVFQVRDSLSIELILLLEQGKRFWEWEAENIQLKKLIRALKQELKREAKRSKE